MFDILLKACHIFQVKTATLAGLTERDLKRILLEDAVRTGGEADEEYAGQLAKDIVMESKN